MAGVDMAQFEQMIMALMSPDNGVRNQAEEALKQAKQNPEALIPAYVQLLRTNPNPQARHRQPAASLQPFQALDVA